MFRGIIGGAMWGLIVGAIAIAVASQLAGERDLTLPEPEAETVEVPRGTEFDRPPPDTDPRAPGSAGGRPADAAADKSLPAAEPTLAAPALDTAPAGVPRPGVTVEAAIDAPEAGAGPELAAVADDPPDLGGAVSPAAPDAETSPVVERPPERPAPPVSPRATAGAEGGADAGGPAPQAPAPGEAAPELAARPAGPGPARKEAAPAGPAAPDRPVAAAAVRQGGADEAPASPAIGEVAVVEPPRLPGASTAPSQPAPGTPAVRPLPTVPPTRPEAAPATGATPGATQQGDAPEVSTDAPRLPGARLPGDGRVGDLAPGVATDRLPRIGDDPGEAATAATPPAVPAIELYAGNAIPGDPRPKLGLLLLDETGPLDRAALDALPFSLTIGVDAGRSGASGDMSRYRAAGLEVAAVPPFPDGATAQDIEVTLAASLAAVPESAVVFVRGAGAASGSAAEQVVLGLTATGHGFLSYDRGINSALRFASQVDLPAGVVFRDLDGEGQSAAVIRRFLDQAAFKARQQGAVILVLRNRPETLRALVDWASGNRAQTVQVVPVSAALKAEPPDAG